MTANLTEAVVEDAALACLESRGWTIAHGWNRPSAAAEVRVGGVKGGAMGREGLYHYS